jgi:hypothetical protein
VVLRRKLLNPFRYGFYSIAFGSRKVLRRVLPVAFLPILVVSLFLASTGLFFATVAAAQLSFVVLAAAGWAFRGERLGRTPLLYVPFFFCLANFASLTALWNLSRGFRIERWTPQRHEPDPHVDSHPLSVVEAGAP